MSRPAGRFPLRRRWALLAVLSFAFVSAYPMQVNGFNQTAHYALVRSLAAGTPNIDKSRGEVGDLSTGDAALYRGHWYAAKPPGLAAASLPAFFIARTIGMRTTGDPTRIIWALHLWGIVLAALVVVLAVWWAGERLVPGFGLAAAVATALGTLVLPFSTLFFSHVPSAALGVAAFAVLWSERCRARGLRRVALAGLLTGLSVVVEYPLVLVAGILGLYALAGTPRLRRALAYGAGAVVGVLPLLAFNFWAFGSPTHIAHEDFFQTAEHRSEGVFLGFSLPSASQAYDLLFSAMGLLVLSPVLALGTAAALGLVIRRREHRLEALVILAIALVYLLYDASLRSVSPFGGLGPPRYLVTLIPFLGIALAVSFRAWPLTSVGLAIVSAFQMVVMTATGPLAAYDGEWLLRARERQFAQTAAAVVEVTGWYTIAPFFLAALAALALLARVPASRAELPLAAGALGAWALVALAADNPNGRPPGTVYVLVLAGAALAFVALRTIQPVSARPAAKSTAEASGQV